jgi:lantibiotic leader peptide-processing serine protease
VRAVPGKGLVRGKGRALRRKTTAFIALTAWVTALALASSADAARYIIVYDRQSVPADASAKIARAGGRVLAEYDAIGVTIAESDNDLFRKNLLRDSRVAGASSTNLVGFESAEPAEAEGPPSSDLPNALATDADTFSALQWNMEQIRAKEAHGITGGSPAVTVAVIDTGIDRLHPDLAANVDSRSVSCVDGAPDPDPAKWNDDSGHGTHVAGIIAAASNGIGVVGVAPNVKIAAIKASVRVGTRDIFRPEAVVCALMWAGDNQLDVANNSYTVDQDLITDPLDFFCRNEADDKMVIKAVQRATQYARHQGVTLVASAGNSGIDLAHPPLGNECLRLPSELPGVVTVSSVGRFEQKAVVPPSNFGVGVIDVTAPGGDATQPAPPPAGLVLSTYPSDPALFAMTVLCDPIQGPPCPRSPLAEPGTAYYRYMAGTSMAAAHVSGVAALIVSRFGDTHNLQNGKLRPGRVEAMLEQTADPLPCPPEPSTCQGGEDYNGWYGHGRINALRAVTHDASG